MHKCQTQVLVSGLLVGQTAWKAGGCELAATAAA